MIKSILLGCGRIGKMHCDNILSNFNDVALNAIFDDGLIGNYKGIPVYRGSQLEEYLAQHSVNAAIIATPSTAHCELIKIMLSRNIATFCEKPISFELDKLQELIALSGFVQVGLNRRWDANFIQLKENLEKGVVGDIQLIKITNRDPLRPDFEFAKNSGGLFYDFNIHDFDMIHFLTDAKITQVFVQGEVLVDERLKSLRDIDTAIITMKLNNGALVVIDSSRETNAGYDQRLEVFGNEGMLSVDNKLGSSLTVVSQYGQQQSLALPNFMSRYHMAYIKQLEAFFNCVKTKSNSLVTLEDVYKAVSIAKACEEALTTNSPINL